MRNVRTAREFLMRMYRGISVSGGKFEEVCADLRANGLTLTSKATWRFEAVDLRSRIEDLVKKPDLSTDDTRPSRWVETPSGGQRVLTGAFPVVCACGDELGATYYAIRHNRSDDKNSSILVTFEAQLSDLHIDGRDFLYNFVFQMGHSEGQRRCALEIFGPALARYLDRAWQRNDTQYRIALCDLAVQDLDVIEKHHANTVVIGGRYGTIFRSAFFVRLPVGPERILVVAPPRAMRFEPDITKDKFLSL